MSGRLRLTWSSSCTGTLWPLAQLLDQRRRAAAAAAARCSNCCDLGEIDCRRAASCCAAAMSVIDLRPTAGQRPVPPADAGDARATRIRLQASVDLLRSDVEREDALLAFWRSPPRRLMRIIGRPPFAARDRRPRPPSRRRHRDRRQASSASHATARNGSNSSTGALNRSCSISRKPSTREAPPLSTMRSM